MASVEFGIQNALEFAGDCLGVLGAAVGVDEVRVGGRRARGKVLVLGADLAELLLHQDLAVDARG